MIMKIVQSFWSKPMLMNDNSDAIFRSNGGWTDRIYFYMSWALSCLKFKEIYNEIELVTDINGKHLLYDILELPYTNVVIKLDDLNDYNHNLWALGKLYAYKLQQEPFIHVDSDVFAWKKFPEKVLSSELIGQNYESNYRCNIEYFNKIKYLLDYIPTEILQETRDTGDIIQVNAGILGGNNISFFKDYVNTAFEMVEKNSTLFNKYPNNKGAFNMVYEQFLFYCMAKARKSKITVLLEENMINHSGLADFEQIPANKYYAHTLGTYKKFFYIGRYIAERLFLEYPEYYNRIVLLYKKNYI